MAQAILRLFNPELSLLDGNSEVSNFQKIAERIPGIVFTTYYPDEVDENTRKGVLYVPDGGITLVAPVVNPDISVSDADYEVEVSSGCEGWPQDESGLYLTQVEFVAGMQDRADRISAGLRSLFSPFSHNIFTTAGLGTGWAQYKPE